MSRFLLLGLAGLCSCVTVKSYDRLETETKEGQTWTIARRTEESRHILAECSSGTGSDVLRLRLLSPKAGRSMTLPSDEATGSSFWYFIPNDTKHQTEHSWRGQVRILQVSEGALEVDVDVDALHPDTGSVCRTYRRRVAFRPDEK